MGVLILNGGLTFMSQESQCRTHDELKSQRHLPYQEFADHTLTCNHYPHTFNRLEFPVLYIQQIATVCIFTVFIIHTADYLLQTEISRQWSIVLLH